METPDLSSLMILAGAAILLISLVGRNREATFGHRGPDRLERRLLGWLIGGFLAGYVAAIVLVVLGRSELLRFFFAFAALAGAVFVSLVVRALRNLDRLDRARSALAESEERYVLAAAGSHDGLWDWDLRRDRIHFSPRWKSMLGHGPDEIGEDPAEWWDRVHPEDAERLRSLLDAHLRGDVPHLEIEYRMRHRDDGYRWVLTRGMTVRDDTDAPCRIAGSQTDITERKRIERHLLLQTTHDELTGLPNRALFVDRVERAIQFARRRPGYLFAVLALDIDRFKLVNDSLGHAMGDAMLATLAKRLRDCLRTTDSVARLGGDEFAVLVEEIRDVADATRVNDRIQAAFADPFVLDGREIFAGASVGIVLSETGYDDSAAVLQDVEIAMYRAKGLGGGRYEVFDRKMRDRIVNRLSLENELRRAIERDELRVHYQPIVELAGERLVGVEALVRWERAGYGPTPPAEFIGLAEETDLIVSIDRWVLAEGCRQMAEWNRRLGADPPLILSVNLSCKQLAQPSLVDQVAEVLQRNGLDARQLKLEITESAFLENTGTITSVLENLRSLGIEIKIDDFGTGYSSLSYLHRLPIDMLKIDRSFIRNIGEQRTDRAIVHTIVLLAQALEIRVVAEGVESAEQAEILRGMHCNFAQGYYFARPMEPQAVERWIERKLGAAVGDEAAIAPAEPVSAQAT